LGVKRNGITRIVGNFCRPSIHLRLFKVPGHGPPTSIVPEWDTVRPINPEGFPNQILSRNSFFSKGPHPAVVTLRTVIAKGQIVRRADFHRPFPNLVKMLGIEFTPCLWIVHLPPELFLKVVEA